MPSYLSHTIMAHDIYQKINHKNIDESYLCTYSLGGDLCKYASCRYASHHKDMDKFIYNMAEYIKRNNLIDNKTIMSVLYAHICHYIMDNTIHPLVRAVDHASVKDKHNHHLIELYYDAYLSKQILGKRIDEYAKGNLLRTKNTKELKKLINYTYKVTYNVNHISFYYQFNLSLYRKIKYLYYIFGYNLLRKISKIDKFILHNQNIDLINSNHKLTYKDYAGKISSDDLITVYNKAIERTITYIKEINKYLKN